MQPGPGDDVHGGDPTEHPGADPAGGDDAGSTVEELFGPTPQHIRDLDAMPEHTEAEVDWGEGGPQWGTDAAEPSASSGSSEPALGPDAVTAPDGSPMPAAPAGPVDEAERLRQAMLRALQRNPEGPLRAITSLAEQIQDRTTGVAAGETTVDPEAAGVTLQQLQAAESALIQLVWQLDVQADSLKAHHSNLIRGGLLDLDSHARAELAKGYQDFLLNFGSLMADFASIADFGESLRENVDDLAEGKLNETVQKVLDADGFYEGLKDIESAFNTARSQGADPDAESPLFNDLLGVAPFLDEQISGNPMLAVQTLKSDVSDVVNLIADRYQGKPINPRTAGQLLIRFLKSYAEWEQALRKLQIKELMASLTAVDAVAATPFIPFLALNEQKHLAHEALLAVREARLSVHSTLATASPGMAAADWPEPPQDLSVEELLVRIGTLAIETSGGVSGEPAAGGPSTVAEIDAAIAAAEAARADVIRRQQVLTSRSAGLDYFEGREQELKDDQTAMTEDLREARRKRGLVDFQWLSRTPQMPRSPGGRPSYRHGYPEIISESPAQLDAQIRDLEIDFRSNTEQLDDLRRDHQLLQSELAEIPILDAELAALDAKLEVLRRDRDAQQITDAISELADEEQAKADAAGAAAAASGRAFFSGMWIIAAAVAVLVVGGAALGFAFLGGGDDASDSVPALSSDGRASTSSDQPSGSASSDQPAPSTEARTPDGQVPELPAGWEAPPPFDRFDTDAEDPTVRWSSGGALWAWSVWQEPELISELEEVDADFAVSQLTTIPAGTAIPNELVISVDCSSDPCSYSTIYGAVAGDVDRRVTVALALNGLELTGSYVPVEAPDTTQVCTREGTYHLEVTDLTVINGRLVSDYVRGERTLQTVCDEYTLNETIQINGRYLFRGSFADQQ